MSVNEPVLKDEQSDTSIGSSDAEIFLPKAADEVGIKNPYREKVERKEEKEYTKEGVTGKDRSTPSPEILVDKSKLKEILNYVADNLTEERAKRLGALLADGMPDLITSYERSTRRIPKWADRTTGRDVSPADWIRLHYGTKEPGGRWTCSDLTRSKLRQLDKSLYQAFNTQLSRLRKQNKPIPLDLHPLIPTSSDRVEQELSKAQIEKPEDVKHAFPNDKRKAEQMRSAIRRRM